MWTVLIFFFHQGGVAGGGGSGGGGGGEFGGSSWGIDGEKSRPHSALDKFVEDRHQPCPPSPRFPPSGLIKGKSMPSLR